MNFHDRKRESFVTLSIAKGLDVRREILRCAQDDSPDGAAPLVAAMMGE